MNTDRRTDSATGLRAPLREQRASVMFMLFLLIISGVTATVVGYRVKSADLDRKAQLLKLYESYGGSFEKAHALDTSLVAASRTPEQNTFLAAYEINCRSRARGLYRVLEATPPDVMQQMIQSLFAIEATEAARSTQDAWNAYRTPPLSEGAAAGIRPNSNPKAIRFAKQYDRYIARDTEVKIFRYVQGWRPSGTNP
ncbi:MAG: hypothetical protein ACK5HO_08890 [Pseudomonadota bacterium]|jgi:hypothetical protein